ncbi:MAG TPA: hypothetical protein VGX48_00555 [Pyrinomonadaceae bacterium]|nr:hypothetical protein [Pyrinomonadaceae bacterium]
MKSWLRRHGLRHSADNETALIALIEKLLDKGDLTLEGLKSAVREIEEYGGKRVYLKQILDASVISDRRKFEKHLQELAIPLSLEKGDSIRTPSKPRLNYAIWSDEEVRVKFTETHTHVKFDKRTRKHEERAVTKFIVMSAEPQTGFLRIYMDPPGDEHPHENDRGVYTDVAYRDHYFSRAEEIFGELDDFKLAQAAERLLQADPPIYEPLLDSGWTPDNFKYTIAGRSDVRLAELYKSGSNERPGLPDLVRGHWIQRMSGNQLERDLYMFIRAAESRIQFKADCLAVEVDYAISRIRTI